MTKRYGLPVGSHEGYSGNMGKTIADFVRDARAARGMTQEELADRLGMTPGYVGILETGKVGRPRVQTLRKLAAALDVPLQDLVATTGQIDAPPSDDIAILLHRIAGLRTPDDRRAAFRQLPESVRKSIRILMRDLFAEVAEMLEE
jgi:transcriptional regulator with XRE-family HTH domain